MVKIYANLYVLNSLICLVFYVIHIFSAQKFILLYPMATAVSSSRNQLILLLTCLDSKHEKEILSKIDQTDVIHIVDSSMLEQTKQEQLNSCVGIMADHIFKLNKSLLAKLPKLKLIVRMGVGFDNVDIEYAGSLGVAVVNLPDYGTEEVADSGMALILNLYRQTFNLASRLKDGKVFPKLQDIIEAAPCARRIRGKTIGLIGLGKIGLSLALKCKAFGFSIQYYDPFISGKTAFEYTAQFGLIHVNSLDLMLAESDTIVTLCPLNKDTRHIINEKTIEKMKNNAFIVNVARGGLIDERALAKALKTGRLSGAGLDVHEVEPFSFENSPLKECDNIICTPHSAFYSYESLFDLATKGCEQIHLMLKGFGYDKLKHCVNINFLNSVEVSKKWDVEQK